MYLLQQCTRNLTRSQIARKLTTIELGLNLQSMVSEVSAGDEDIVVRNADGNSRMGGRRYARVMGEERYAARGIMIRSDEYQMDALHDFNPH